MTRDLGLFEAESLAASLRPFMAVKFEFESGPVRYWGGIGDLAIFGETYLGTGTLLRLEPAVETDDLRAEGARYVLTGVDPAIVSIALQETYTGRPATLFIGGLGSDGKAIADPTEISSGRMDIMNISVDGETATVELTVESELAAFERAPNRRYTPEDQKIDFPNDKGLDFIPKLQDTDLVWG